MKAEDANVKVEESFTLLMLLDRLLKVEGVDVKLDLKYENFGYFCVFCVLQYRWWYLALD
jgi:hypothetical protein